MATSQSLRLAYSVDKGPAFPFSATTGAPQINVFGQVLWQIGGVQVNTVSLVYPAWTGAQDQTFSFALTSFPATISLPVGASGIVYASTALALAPQSGVVLSQPVLSVVFGSGSPLNAAGTGTASFALQPGRKYGNLSLSGSVRAFAQNPSPQQTIVLTVWAMLLGHSAS